MRLLAYAPPRHPLYRNVINAMDGIESVINTIHANSVETLVSHLRFPYGSDTILVLAPAGHEELDALIAQRHLLRDLRIILLLPDDDSRMATDGHLLRPRFVSQGAHEYATVKAIVVRMVRNIQAHAVVGQPRVHTA